MMMLTLAPVTYFWHRFGTQHALLLGRQLGVKSLGCLSTLHHFGVTHIGHRLHFVDTLRRVEFCKFISHRLAIGPIGRAAA